MKKKIIAAVVPVRKILKDLEIKILEFYKNKSL